MMTRVIYESFGPGFSLPKPLKKNKIAIYEKGKEGEEEGKGG